MERWGLWGACATGVGLQAVGEAPWAAAALVTLLGALAMWEPGAFRRLNAPRFWSIAALLALSLGAFAAPADSHVAGVPFSQRGLAAGFVLLCRAGTLFAVAVVVSRHFSYQRVTRLTRKIGLPRLGAALGLAVNATPLLADTARETAGILKLRVRGAWSFPRRLERLVVGLLLRAEGLARETAWQQDLILRAPTVPRKEADGGELHARDSG